MVVIREIATVEKVLFSWESVHILTGFVRNGLIITSAFLSKI